MNKKLFYTLNMTWGIIMNVIGYICAGVLSAAGIKPERHKGLLVYRVGENWGGLNLGLVVLASHRASEKTLNHEVGHAIQNAIYGPFHIFIVAIPSAIRYWYRTFTSPSTAYDSAWFEGQATEWGNSLTKDW